MKNEKLLRQCEKGDRKSIKHLYDLYADEMYTTSYRITNDKQASEDILQESFITSINNLSKLQKKENYQGWYRRIVINTSLKYIKQRISFENISTHNESVEIEYHSWYIDIPMSLIKEAIQQLPTKCRTIFSLYAIENYKHTDIASELDISVSTSKTQYRYAKKLLRAYLIKVYAV